ncbi:MAG: N-acetyltransferase [Verrucomicrobia bacterium]|nr:N-acetyltransferase [Verrucomicrobiota bacterium]
MSHDVRILPLSCRPRDVLRFLRVSEEIYRDDPLWVAPLLLDAKKVFTDANPLFEHAEMQLWVAVKDGQDVGRIAGILDHNYVRVQNDPAAFFGFFECVNDPAVSSRLFAAVSDWARQKSARRLLGPMNPTTNDECGLLVEGFDASPALMMPYNPRRYADLVEAQGFRKAKDLLAYHLNLRDTPMDRLEKLAGRVKKKWPELSFRPIRRQTLDADLVSLKEIYNAAWEANWGFVPMTNAEIDFMAGRLKPLLHMPISWLVETATEPIGFLLALPDYNVAFKPLRGHLATPKLLGALPYLLGWKYPTLARVITLGVKASYRGKGLESVMLFEGLKEGFRHGLTDAEASWVLEDNTMMNRLMEVYAGRVYKRYRIYEKEVGEGPLAAGPRDH